MLPEAILAQNILVVFLLLGVAIKRSASRREGVVRLLGAWSLMIGLLLVGVWIAPPPIKLWTYCVLLVFASVLHVLRSAGREPFRLLRLSHIPTFASIGLGGLFLWQGLSGRLQPDIEFVNLAPPMRPAEGICVISEGNSLALNAHFIASSSPLGFQEMHSVDFVKVRSNGFRTRSWQLSSQPKDIAEYLIYNEPVFAPCTGSVQEMKNNQADHPAGGQYRDKLGVNFVRLRCGKVDINLVHLKRGSIEVSVGQSLTTGDFIGKVGNSGNTEEPHLHIQAQTIPTPESGDTYPQPVPMTFNGQYLSRGECL